MFLRFGGRNLLFFVAPNTEVFLLKLMIYRMKTLELRETICNPLALNPNPYKNSHEHCDLLV